MTRTHLAAGLIALLIAGCSSQSTDSTADSPATPSASSTSTGAGEASLLLNVFAVSWKTGDGASESCSGGLTDSSFWFEQSSLNIYDEATGDQLLSTTLTAEEASAGGACNYAVDDLLITEVPNYRFVFDGRHSVTKSLADLKIHAQELNDRLGFKVSDLSFIDEVGAP